LANSSRNGHVFDLLRARLGIVLRRTLFQSGLDSEFDSALPARLLTASDAWSWRDLQDAPGQVIFRRMIFC
jgi:hypothetical protein